MPTTDTSEKGLETLIMKHMTGSDGLEFEADAAVVEERPRAEEPVSGHRRFFRRARIWRGEAH
jgi:hypothetical protein